MSNEKNNDIWWGIIIGAVGATVIYYLATNKRNRNPKEEMREIINKTQNNSSIRNAVANITQNCKSGDSICEISNIFNFVTNKIKYMHDPKRKDYFAHPLETLKLKIGDCDCKSILLATLLESIGHNTRLALIPGHVYVEVCVDKKYIPMLPSSASYSSENGHVWIPLESTAEGAYIGWMSKNVYEAIDSGNIEYG